MYCDQCGKRFPGPGVIITVKRNENITVCDQCASARLDRLSEKIKRNDHFQMIRLFDDGHPFPIDDNAPLRMGTWSLNIFEQQEFLMGYYREVEEMKIIRSSLVRYDPTRCY